MNPMDLRTIYVMMKKKEKKISECFNVANIYGEPIRKYLNGIENGRFRGKSSKN